MVVLSYAVLAFWLLALGRTILNILATPRLRARMPRRTPLVSAIVPARDEERTIERTVRALLAQTYPQLEVIVINDRSVDATGSILEHLRKEDSRLVVITGEEPPPGWLGKVWALHEGSRRARGELLLFLDADVIYQRDAIAAAVAELEESDSDLIALMPLLETHGFWESVVMPNLGVFLFTMLPVWLANRTRVPLLAIGGGPGNLVRRASYDLAGGHEALHDAVVDDVALARLVRRSGGRTTVVRADHCISVRMYHGLREIISGFTKNAFAVFGYNYFVAFFFLAVAIVFHILPYALALTGDAVALVTIGLIAVTRVIVFVPLRYRIDNAILGHPLMTAVWCWILLRSVWFTGIRRQLHWRGRTYDAGRTRFGAD